MEPTYRELAGRWKALRGRNGLRVREVACVGAARTLLCVECGDASSPAIALAAGVHGDEPAGPSALLALVENDALDSRFSYRIWPCTNPTGYDARTRESAQGVDLNRTFGRGGSSPEARAIVVANRDRSFALALDLHEDCDASGFYCYEYGEGGVGRAVVSALERAGWPIDPLEATFDAGGPIDPAHCRRERGCIFADPQAEAAALGGLSYSLALARRAARRALTFETPALHALDDRIGMHRAAVVAAIGSLSEK